LSVPDHPLLRPSGQFTVDFWVFLTDVSAFQGVLSKSNSGSFAPYLLLCSGGRLSYLISSNGSAWDVANNIDMGAIAASTWTHVALTWDGAVWRPFVNGVMGTTVNSSVMPLAAADAVVVGNYQSSAGGYTSSTRGYVDEIRISKVARWTANFTPSPVPYSSPATALVVTIPATATIGIPTTVTVTAVDAFGNSTYYTGAIHFTSTDGAASLPADSTLTNFSSGTFSVTFNTLGIQTVTATGP
jgi:hypothetical protein